jgi:hypothetical protein
VSVKGEGDKSKTREEDGEEKGKLVFGIKYESLV